ncbi:MAG: topoisomerase C-terminal repeat-containing protein, partial [Amphiplicatus sp.]
AKEVGKHPEDGKAITIRSGRYGPYLQHGSLRAALPKDTKEDAVTIESAIEILSAKAAKGAPGKMTKKGAKKATKKTTKKAAKKTAKKKTAKKAAKKTADQEPEADQAADAQSGDASKEETTAANE